MTEGALAPPESPEELVVGIVEGAAPPAHRSEGSWAALGDSVLHWAPSAAESSLSSRLSHMGVAPALQRATGRLYLVGQVGRSFEREHPEVRVLLSKGRYLVVLVPAAQPAPLPDAHACWALRPLQDAQIVFAQRAPQRAARAPWIEALVAAVSESRLMSTITFLAGLGTRHSLSAQFVTAAHWVREELSALGFAVELATISVGGANCSNVIANRSGSGPSRGVVLLTAHLDSVNESGGIGAPAPGADDNASGVAGALEIARVLSSLPELEHDLRVILFGGEEQGLHGSQQYLAGLSASERARLRAVINMDMIATSNTAQATVLLEGGAPSQPLIDALASAAATYTSLQVQTSLNPFASDHVPFIQAGIGAVLTIEGADSANHNVHTAGDTVDHVNAALAAAIVQMNVATAAGYLLPLGPSLGKTSASGPIVSWGSNRVDAFVVGTSSAAFHKWLVGASWGPSELGYESLGGACASPIEAVAWGDNRLDAFVVGTDSRLYHKWWNGSAWGPSVTGWESLGGTCTSQPKAVAWGPHRLDLFVIGTDSQLYHKWWNGSAWGPSLTGYESLGGTCLALPEAVAWGANRLDVFVIGTDRALYHKWWNGSAWGPSVTGYENVGGICLGNPKVASWGDNRLDVFVIGTDRVLYHKWWNGSAWGPSVTGYESLGGTCMSDPAVISWGANRLDVFVIGTDRALYHKWWDGAAWGPSVSGYESLGGTCIAGPFVTSSGANRLDVFVTGTDNALYQRSWNGSVWSAWRSLGGVVLPAPRVQIEASEPEPMRSLPMEQAAYA